MVLAQSSSLSSDLDDNPTNQVREMKIIYTAFSSFYFEHFLGVRWKDQITLTIYIRHFFNVYLLGSTASKGLLNSKVISEL